MVDDSSPSSSELHGQWCLSVYRCMKNYYSVIVDEECRRKKGRERVGQEFSEQICRS